MSVVLMGVDMPDSCQHCPMLDWDLDYVKCKATDRHFHLSEPWKKSRVSDCPMIEETVYRKFMVPLYEKKEA